MGTINYMTSDYITLGLRPFDLEDIQEGYDEKLSDDELFEIKSYLECEVMEDVKNELKNHSFTWWKVEIEPGYYEGFSVRIESYFDLWMYSSEKQEANKEVTEIKKLLEKLVNDFGLVSCLPWWCTTYHNKEESLKYIQDAVKEMRLNIKKVKNSRGC